MRHGWMITRAAARTNGTSVDTRHFRFPKDDDDDDGRRVKLASRCYVLVYVPF